MGHPRHCDHLDKGEIATSPIQSEQLVKALPSLPGGGLGCVPDLGLATFCVFIPMLPREWQYITSAVSFYKGSTCLWSGVGRGHSRSPRAEGLLCLLPLSSSVLCPPH